MSLAFESRKKAATGIPGGAPRYTFLPQNVDDAETAKPPFKTDVTSR
jgi:hypothetical protein